MCARESKAPLGAENEQERKDSVLVSFAQRKVERMKLVACRSCGDMFSLRMTLKKCHCKESSGKYLSDGLNAVVSGKNAVVIGFENQSLKRAISLQKFADNEFPNRWAGERFEAFIIPRNATSVERKD